MKKDKHDVSEYRIGKFTLLQLMALLAIVGIVGFCILKWVLG